MNDERSTIYPRAGGVAPTDAQSGGDDATLRFSGFEFDCRRDELRRDGVAIPIRPKPRALLRHLLEQPGRLLSKDELMSALWGPVIVSDDSLVQCVGELRAALGDQRQQLIKTLPRRGYMLDTAIERLTTRPQPLPDMAPESAQAKRPRHSLRWWLLPALCVLLLGAAGAVWKLHDPPAFRIDDEISDRHAVAVLPLVDTDQAEGTSAVGKALADDIGNEISMRQRMRVIGPGSTAQYSAGAPDMARIGRELEVHYVIGGRVLHDGGVIVVDSQLISIESGAMVRLNRSTFATANEALHSNLGQRVASALRMRYDEIENERVSRPGYVPDAADQVMMGWYDMNHFASRDDLLRAQNRFEAALRVDPDSVAALQGLGSAYLIELVNSFSAEPQRLLELGKRALGRAMELSPERPENLLPWGSVLELSGQPAEAMALYEKALEIHPNYAFGHLFLAHALILQGRFAEAQQHIDRARGLSPSDTRLIYALYKLSAAADFVQGRDDDAYAMLQQWVAEYPKSGQPYAMLAAIDALRGHDAEAAAHMARHRELLPNDTVAYVVFLNPSTDPSYLAQRARLIEGLRKAGLPER